MKKCSYCKYAGVVKKCSDCKEKKNWVLNEKEPMLSINDVKKLMSKASSIEDMKIKLNEFIDEITKG